MASKLESPRYVMVGDVADVQRHRAQTVLRKQGLNPVATFEFAATKDCTICGLSEVKQILMETLPVNDSSVWELEDGDGAQVEANEVVLRVKTPVNSLIVFQSAILGTLASCSGWATAARECVDASDGVRVIFSGTQRIHPNLVPQLEYAATKGGCSGVSTPLGSRLAGVSPSGSISSFLITALGDLPTALEAFDQHMPPEVPRIALLGVFKDEAEDADAAAKTLENLAGVHVGVTNGRGESVSSTLLKEVRERLKRQDSENVDISVSGNLNPSRIAKLREEEAPVDAFVVGGYIAEAQPIPFKSSIKDILDEPVIQRGEVPGLSNNPRLARVSLQPSQEG